MSYQLCVMQHGTLKFYTDSYSASTRLAIVRLYTLFEQKFPASDGYQLNVDDTDVSFRHIPGFLFSRIIASSDPINMLQRIANDDAFNEFRQDKEEIDARSAAGEYQMDLDAYGPVSAVLLYSGEEFIIDRGDVPKKFLLPGDQPVESDWLEELEYLLFIQDILTQF